MRCYECKFDIAQTVRIPELDTKGKILNIWIVERGISYEVRYFHSGEAKSVYFYENELEEIKEDRR
jgi:hypothetical protein